MRLSFGECVFDSGTHEVLIGGRPTGLSPKAFALLDLLIARRPNAVSREEIHERLWPGTFVSDSSVANLVAELRERLGDDARQPRIIRTVHRFGYAFRAEPDPAIDRPAAAAGRSVRIVCRLLWDGREILLKPGENVLGREPEAAVWIDDSAVSRRHARIVVGSDGATLEDLGSKNGTKLQGTRIQSVERLVDRAAIQIGPASMVFRVYRETGSTETAVEDESPA
jgi:DNA-binding winged helix-turn-helix (wHTH) protein